MNFKTVFLSSTGRMARRDFWIAVFLMGITRAVFQLLPGIGTFVTLVLIYPYVCVYAKRLHDFGQSGWLAAVPFGVFGVVAAARALMPSLGMDPDADHPSVAQMALMSGLGHFVLVALFGFVLWVGLNKGDAQPNDYGPPPGATLSRFDTAPT